MRLIKSFYIIVMIAGLIKGLLAGSLATTGAVKVAVLDSGSNIPYKEGISLIDGTVKDYNGHGTLIADIIKEVCPEAELYIVKVMRSDGMAVNEEMIIRGIEWAISREVNVINMSLRLKDSERLHYAIQKAYERGIVIVAAAGNKMSGSDTLTMQDVRYNANYEVAYPAQYDEVVAVGALDELGRAYGGSIQGKEVEVMCKGYKGRKIGTSISSAYAAGFAAKIISRRPVGNVQEVREIMSKGIRRDLLR